LEGMNNIVTAVHKRLPYTKKWSHLTTPFVRKMTTMLQPCPCGHM